MQPADKGKEKITRKKVEKKKEITFNYEIEEPTKEIKSLDDLKKTINENFPEIWKETKACLSTVCSLSLKNLNGCPSLILVGNPSGEKTTVTSFFYGHKTTYLSDDFTPKAFVSHSVNVKAEELESIDLLPRIQNKAIITPELAPIFEAPKDDLIKSFSMLTRVLDGEGLNRDTGTHGHRGYSGDYKFAWLGATTPLRYNVWHVMGKLGNRLFFLQMSDKNRSDEEYLKMFTVDEEYEEKIKICRGAVHSYLSNFFKKYPIRSTKWSNEQDAEIIKIIIKYAKLLSKLRGSLITWKSSKEQNEYEHTFPIIEEPPRAINALRNFARGHALIHNRKYLCNDDLWLVRDICLSSMPHDRIKFLEILKAYDGRLAAETLEQEMGCSRDTALRTMKVFEVLGVVKLIDMPIGEGRPIKYVELLDEFKELLLYTQGRNGAINYKSQENGGVSDQNNQQTHPRNGAKKSFSHENAPVCNELIHHKCYYCGETPCVAWDKRSRPICGDCARNPNLEVEEEDVR